MITANDARNLAQESETAVLKHCEIISKHIEKAAAENKREIYLSGLLHNPLYDVNKPAFYAPEYTAFQKVLKQKLEENGFTVAIESHEYDLNKTFNSMAYHDDPPNMQESYYITVKW